MVERFSTGNDSVKDSTLMHLELGQLSAVRRVDDFPALTHTCR
jgi:hypothetical protein